MKYIDVFDDDILSNYRVMLTDDNGEQMYLIPLTRLKMILEDK